MKRVSVPSLPASTRATNGGPGSRSRRRRRIPRSGGPCLRSDRPRSAPRCFLETGDMPPDRAVGGEDQHVDKASRLAPVQDDRAGVMAVGTNEDRDRGPMAADRPHQATQKRPDLDAYGRCAGRRTAVTKRPRHEDDDRLEAYVVEGVEQAQLLAACTARRCRRCRGRCAAGPGGTSAVDVDQSRRGAAATAQTAGPSREMVDSETGPVRRHAFERQLEQRIDAQAGSVVAVLVAGGDHQHPEADDVGDRMHGAAGITRIVDAGGQTVGDFEPAFNLMQKQQSAVGETVGNAAVAAFFADIPDHGSVAWSRIVEQPR